MGVFAVIISFVVSVLFCSPTFGAEKDLLPKELPRKILALYKIQPADDEDTQDDIIDTPTHLHAEVVLNHLGLEVVHHSIDEPLPSKEKLAGYRGIMSWFQEVNAVPDPNAYCRWAKQMMKAGLKFVILGKPGIFANESRIISRSCQSMFNTLGARYDGDFSDNPFYFQVVEKDANMVEFERKLLLTEKHEYAHYQTIVPEAKTYLKLQRRDQKDKVSDLVFTTPRGGFVHPSYVHYVVKDLGKVQWRLNPFRFFNEAFGMQGLPRPDTTTINGRRIFYAHIDGDGIVNETHIRKKTYSGTIITEEILERYPNLPTTISLITGYFDMREFQYDRVTNMYRDMLRLPNTEVASHAHTHPLVWKKSKLALDVPGYTYSDEYEILGSMQRIRDLLKQLGIEKTVRLFLWTGDCRPEEAQLAIANNASVLAMNGGDARFDRRYDSYSFLYPLSFLRGEQRQIYSSAPNENVYTNEWEGPYYGFSDIIETFQNTESPIRMKPINIYYHFYSGEVAAALSALKKAYAYAVAEDIFPIFAGDYVPIVRDFFDIRIAPLSGGGYQILNQGHLRTIRFDNETRHVDLQRSRGIVGFQHLQGSLYVSLDERRSHDIYLTTHRQTRPYVINANFHIKDFSGTATRLTFQKKGWLTSEAVFGGMLPNQKYWVHIDGNRTEATSTTTGELTIRVPQGENAGAYRSVLVARHFF